MSIGTDDDEETKVNLDQDFDDDLDDSNDDDLDDDLDDDDVDEDAPVTTHEDTVVDEDLESLVARLDKTDTDDVAKRREIRRKIEEAREAREQDLDSTYNFNIDEDL